MIKKQKNELVKAEEKSPTIVESGEIGLYLDTAKFEHGWRVANMLASSTMVPKHFQENVGNCMIALNLSARVGLDPFMLMQKMGIIQGKPALEAQLIISLVNRTGLFTPIDYELTGEGDEMQCYAYATKLSTGKELKGPVVSIDMAKKEGWYGKAGSKWKTMPELMLRYRAASFFCSVYCPEAKLGMLSNEEAHDIKFEKEEPAQNMADDFKEDPPKEVGNKKATAVKKEEPRHRNTGSKLDNMQKLSPTAFGMVVDEVGMPRSADDFEKFCIRFEEVLDS